MSKHNSWTSITLDLLLAVARKTILHPFVAWMLPLSLKAQATPYSHLSFQITTAYASFLTVFWLFSVLNSRIAYGKPRPCDGSDDVVVITGGASGLGLMIAEFLAMRGTTVAVLDVKPGDVVREAKGIAYYRCDVGNAQHVGITARRIQNEVSSAKEMVALSSANSRSLGCRLF